MHRCPRQGCGRAGEKGVVWLGRPITGETRSAEPPPLSESAPRARRSEDGKAESTLGAVDRRAIRVDRRDGGPKGEHGFGRGQASAWFAKAS
jgi:hypothetical protein